jgi:hypothetical protein
LEHLFFTHANLSFTKHFTGEITQPFPPIVNPSRIKADQQKEDENVHLPRKKKKKHYRLANKAYLQQTTKQNIIT